MIGCFIYKKTQKISVNRKMDIGCPIHEKIKNSKNFTKWYSLVFSLLKGLNQKYILLLKCCNFNYFYAKIALKN